MKKQMLFCISLLAVFIATGSAQAWVGHVVQLAQAGPDECYAGPGVPYPAPISQDPFTCPQGSKPKTNQTYTWSLTQEGNSLWFGTGANVVCTTIGAFSSSVSPDTSDASICEYGDSQIFKDFPTLPEEKGDWRPPMFYEYNLQTGRLIDRTPYNDRLRNRNLGLRSAGSHKGVVFYAGGSLGGGISMFAFDAVTKEYLGSRRFTAYRTIRKWIVVNDQLYTGVGTTFNGRVLRWMGSRNDPFNFIEVGQVRGVPRELAEYIDANGRKRIAASANGVYLSPAITGDGLTSGQAGNWQQIWSPNEYEPDYIARLTYTGGGIAFLNGWLYFGTMHVPYQVTKTHESCTFQPGNFPLPGSRCFGEPRNSTEEEILVEGTQRATTIWRIKNAESANRVTQLLYGEARLPAYNSTTRSFPLVNNLGGYQPLLGSSGFNNKDNHYSWVMEVMAGRLFIGTMDIGPSGADLWSIAGTSSNTPVPAVAETTSAFSEILGPVFRLPPYGFRTLIRSEDGTRLFAGTATGVNLGAVGEGAGWHLLELLPQAP